MGTVNLELEEHEMRELMEMSALILQLLDQAPLEETWQQRVDTWEGLCNEILEAGQQIPSLTRELEYNAETGGYEYSAAYVRRSLFNAVLEKNQEISFWTQLVSRLCQRSLQADLGANFEEELRELPLAERADLLEQTMLDEMSQPYLSEEESAPPPPPQRSAVMSSSTAASSGFSLPRSSMPAASAASASMAPPSSFGYAAPAPSLNAAEQRAILDEVGDDGFDSYEDFDDYEDFGDELSPEELARYGGSGGMRG